MSAIPPFDKAVPPGGYAWWYIDALDLQGRYGLAIIGFVGSVFSPYYAWARRRGMGDPLQHCAINVALYPPAGHYWSMTERGGTSVWRSADALCVGPSALHWDGKQLRIEIDEVTAPLPRRLRGTITVHPTVGFAQEIALEPGGGHCWRPYFPYGEVEVDLREPAMRWRGTAYCDHNHGNTPLEQAFTHWQWTRAHLPGERTAVVYDAQPRAATATAFTLHIARDGAARSESMPPRLALGRSAWGMAREAAADPGSRPRLLRALESGPFYARSLLATTLDGCPVLAVHETLSLERFAAAWVQAMLPFRMPRAWPAQRSAGRSSR